MERLSRFKIEVIISRILSLFFGKRYIVLLIDVSCCLIDRCIRYFSIHCILKDSYAYIRRYSPPSELDIYYA